MTIYPARGPIHALTHVLLQVKVQMIQCYIWHLPQAWPHICWRFYQAISTNDAREIGLTITAQLACLGSHGCSKLQIAADCVIWFSAQNSLHGFITHKRESWIGGSQDGASRCRSNALHASDKPDSIHIVDMPVSIKTMQCLSMLCVSDFDRRRSFL